MQTHTCAIMQTYTHIMQASLNPELQRAMLYRKKKTERMNRLEPWIPLLALQSFSHWEMPLAAGQTLYLQILSQQLPIVHSVAGLNSNRFICVFGTRRCEKHALSHFLNEIACKSISWFPCSLHRHGACNWQLSEHWAGQQSWEEVLMGEGSPWQEGSWPGCHCWASK